MNAIKTTVRNGRIEVDAPDELPDGTEVLVDVTPITDRIGIDESEWQDDAQALADWGAWLKTIEPIELTAQERDAFARFDDAFRRFNVEQVRRQMQQGLGP